MNFSRLVRPFLLLRGGGGRQIRHVSQSHDAFFTREDVSVLPVLVVGAGPVGLVLSILLAKLGVRCSVLEKSKAFSIHPQAHFINNRSMEVFRKMDGLSEEIQRSQPPLDLWRKFIYCTSLTGQILGTVDHMQPQDVENIVSPVSVAHFSQYKLIRLLLRKLEDLEFLVRTPEESQLLTDGLLCGGELLMGHECVSIDATDKLVNVTVAYVNQGNYTERNIKCNVLVGTDGAGSSVRKLVGIKMEGEEDLQKLVSVHFVSRDLGRYLLYERPGMLFFVFNTETIGVLVAHDLEHGEFILQVPYYPPQQNFDDFNPEMCKQIISMLVGRELLDVNVMDIKPWVMHAEVAERFSYSDNRIILAGDAAHRFPPAGGFGMNTGIQDVHNLAWKIASVAKGIASPAVLNTYEMERKPIAVFNTALSVQNFRAATAVPAALGLDHGIAKSVHQAITKGVGSILPSGMQRALLEGIFRIGRAQLAESFLNDNNPVGSSRLAKLRRILEEGKSLQLQFPAEDLGFRYNEGALVSDDNSHLAYPPSATGRKRNYIPSADPGSRLPHMDVQILSKREVIISTLDLISSDKLEFLLIVAADGRSYDLARAASDVAKELKVSIKVCVIWPAGTDSGAEARSKAELAPRKNFIDVSEVKRSPNSLSWWSMCRMTDKGAILVRPDEHIAWRIKSSLEKDPFSEMRKVFSTILRINR